MTDVNKRYLFPSNGMVFFNLIINPLEKYKGAFSYQYYLLVKNNQFSNWLFLK